MFSIKKFSAVLVLVYFFVLFAAGVAFAADDQMVPCGGPGQHACTICDFFEMTRRVTNYVMFGIIPVTFAFCLIMGGGYLVWTKGDPSALINAKGVIKVAIIGFLTVFIGWVFVNTMFMALGIADWDGFKLNESWWKISARCSMINETSKSCGDGIWQDNEGCDPKMTVATCQGKSGYSKELCNTIISKCDPNTCKAEYCGDGQVTGDEACDYNESLADCKARKPDYTDKKCLDLIDNCNSECKIVAVAACTDVDKTKIGKGCWLTNDITDREKYCQRGKYICDDDPESPTYNKVVCRALDPKVYDDCCLDRGEKLDEMAFNIVRIRDYVKLGVGAEGDMAGYWVYCGSKAIDCDTVCKGKGQVCIGVGLGNWQKSKCVSVVHHIAGDCSLDENLVTNDCRAKYCLSDAICCEGGTCKDNLKPCCDSGTSIFDPYTGQSFKGSGPQFSVGETACYCK